MDRKHSRPKILLLGISYPDVYGHMKKHEYDDDILSNTELSVDQAIECVRRKILTEMDGRDLARCVATEQVGIEKDSTGNVPNGRFSHDVYTVSKEVGGVYRKDRHIYANFNNSRGFRKAMMEAFGTVQFQQVILDYYWMPTGWLVTRWNKTLFQETLPDLVRHNLLIFPGARLRSPTKSTNHNSSSNNDKNCVRNDELEEGVVFLPFCAHVCKELVGGIHILRKYYSITFVKKTELSVHALWKGTMSIDAETMQHRLGKRLDQEEVYCTFKPGDIYQSMEDAHVNKDDVMRMLLSIEDFDSVRMIRLRPLRQHEPPSVFRNTIIEPEEGGFIGLNWARGKDLFNRTKRIQKPPPPKPHLKVKRKLQRKRKTVRKPKIVSPIVEESDSENSDFVYDTDSASSSDDTSDDEEKELDARDDENLCDPYKPSEVPDVTNYYPYPALDINSYIIKKDTIDDDHVMSSWAETWGPKSARKKNRKQDILQNEYKKFRKSQKSYLTSNARLPASNKDDEEGYKWTLAGDDGWKLSLKGDAHDARYESKIVRLAKRDYAMTACRQLFEMKNPGFKTLSRFWPNSDNFISCYQIPKESVLIKREKAAMTAKKLKSKTADDNECENFPVSLDESDSSCDQYSDDEDKTESELREDESFSDINQQHKKIDSNQDSSILSQFADIASTSHSVVKGLPLQSIDERTKDGPIHDELRAICEKREGHKGVFELIMDDDLPPFKPKGITKHLFYDLTPNENFPRELYRLLQDAEEKVIAHIISWQPRNRSFKIHDRNLFERLVLSECCDTATYDSFINNLISFGFCEICIGSRRGGYRHEFFRRGKPKNLALICQDEFVTVARDNNDESVSNHFESMFDLSCNIHFIENLYCLLQNSKMIGLTDIVSWDGSGKSFTVHKPKIFSKKVLKMASRKVSFKKFNKRMINHGFKVRGDSNSSYEHKKFIRGDRKMLKDISNSGSKKSMIDAESFGCDNESNMIAIQSNKRMISKETAKRPFKALSDKSEIMTPKKAKKSNIQNRRRPQYDVSNSPKFPQELYNLIEDSEKEGYNNFIDWLPAGDAFAIKNITLFTNTILRRSCIGKSYKTFSSFQNTLDCFGFEKIEIDSTAGTEYRHQHFVRGRVSRLNSIVPRSNKTKMKTAPMECNVVTSADTSVNERSRSSSPSSQSVTLRPPSETEDLDLNKVINLSIVKSQEETLVSGVNENKQRRKLPVSSKVEEKLLRRTTRLRAVSSSQKTEVVADCDVSVKKSNNKSYPSRESRKRKCRKDSSPVDRVIVVRTG